MRGRRRQSRARLVALLLRVDVVALIAIERDLRGDRSIDLGLELRRAEFGLDPDLRQLVAQLHVVANLPTLADIDIQIAALRLVRLYRGLDATHTHHSSQRRDRRFIAGLPPSPSVPLTSPHPATPPAPHHV